MSDIRELLKAALGELDAEDDELRFWLEEMGQENGHIVMMHHPMPEEGPCPWEACRIYQRLCERFVRGEG